MNVGELITELQKYPKDIEVTNGHSIIEKIELCSVYMDRFGGISRIKLPWEKLKNVNVVKLTSNI